MQNHPGRAGAEPGGTAVSQTTPRSVKVFEEEQRENGSGSCSVENQPRNEQEPPQAGELEGEVQETQPESQDIVRRWTR